MFFQFLCPFRENGFTFPKPFAVNTTKPTGKRPQGRPGRRWEDNIRMDLKEICVNTRNWVYSAQDTDYWKAYVNAALNLRVP